MTARGFADGFERVKTRAKNRDVHVYLVLLVLALGIGFRLLFWKLYPPIWKLHAVFNVLELPLLEYVGNFESYKPSRMPFYDVFAAGLYVPFAGLFGVRALTLSNVVISSISLPVFYEAVRRILDRRVALFALILFAFYPKLIVLTARGIPEAASVAFVAFALYGLAVGEDSGYERWYLVAGLFALISYLMFVSAVAFGMLAVGYLYLKDNSELGSPVTTIPFRALLPPRSAVLFSIPPGVGGILYLNYGPIAELLADVSANRLSVFTDPAGYSLIEKVFRYLSYVYFDFWWHLRGFDRERGIRPLLDSLQGFLDGLFPVYFGGWIVITGMASLLVVYGLYLLYRRRTVFSYFVLGWVATYLLLFNYKNIGWVGGFQTRHVLPILPALCIAFGIGVGDLTKIPSFDRRIPEVDKTKLATACLLVMLGVLVVNGAVQGEIRGQKHIEEKQEPIAALNALVQDGESVGVVTFRDYHDIVLYTENGLQPSILVGTDQDRLAAHRYTVRADVRVVDGGSPEEFDVTYLYLRVEYNYLERIGYTIPIDQAFVEDLKRNHEVVYRKEIQPGSFRTTGIEILVIRL